MLEDEERRALLLDLRTKLAKWPEPGGAVAVAAVQSLLAELDDRDGAPRIATRPRRERHIR